MIFALLFQDTQYFKSIVGQQLTPFDCFYCLWEGDPMTVPKEQHFQMLISFQSTLINVPLRTIIL